MMEALEPFRVPGPPRGVDDPEMLPYLRPVDDLSLDINVEVRLASSEMVQRGAAAQPISRANFKSMHWTIAQMLVHHTSTGCNLRPGDLLASGTISGRDETSRGCLLERSWRGTEPLVLPSGERRTFLEDGDTVTLRGWCVREGRARIGFGACTGTVVG